MLSSRRPAHVFLPLVFLLAMSGCATSHTGAGVSQQMIEIAHPQKGWSWVANTPPKIVHRVLLLPGLLGTDAIYADLLKEQGLADRGIQLVAANPPGFKGMPADEGFDYSMESYAMEVEAFAREQDCDLIVGHSFFGNVLIEVAARKKFAGKLVLLSPSLNREAEEFDTRAMDTLSYVPGVGTFVMWCSYGMMESVLKPYLSEEKYDKLPLLAAEANKTPPGLGVHLLQNFFKHIDKYGDLTDRLATATAPVWYVRGSLDAIQFSKKNRDQLEKTSPVKVREIAGAHHLAMVDQPLGVSKIILQAYSLESGTGDRDVGDE